MGERADKRLAVPVDLERTVVRRRSPAHEHLVEQRRRAPSRSRRSRRPCCARPRASPRSASSTSRPLRVARSSSSTLAGGPHAGQCSREGAHLSLGVLGQRRFELGPPRQPPEPMKLAVHGSEKLQFSRRRRRRSGLGGSINGSIPGARCRLCKWSREKRSRFTGTLQSPLTDSNRRPPPYHGGSQAVLAGTAGHSRSRFSCKSRRRGVSPVLARARACPA